MIDAGQLLRGAVLAPPHSAITVEDHRGVCLTLVDQSLLQRAIALDTLSPLRGLRVEPEAPATTPDTVVPLDQPGKGVPGVGAKRFDRVLSDVGSVDPIADGGRPVCRRLANPIDVGQPRSVSASGKGKKQSDSHRPGHDNSSVAVSHMSETVRDRHDVPLGLDGRPNRTSRESVVDLELVLVGEVVW